MQTRSWEEPKTTRSSETGGDDNIDGGDGNDTIIGNDGNDYLYGGIGDDELDGGNGDDTIHGADGNDSIQGGAGNDNLNGQLGNDAISGGTGHDILNGHEGDDLLTGSIGNDTIDGSHGHDSIFGGDGNDVIHAGNDNDTVSGGDGDDLIYGEAGNDQLLGNLGSDRLYGGDNDDVLIGHEGNDILDGSAGDDLIYGGDGDDILNGGFGNDQLLGEAGNDSLDAGVDNDLLSGGDGLDNLFGSSGNDVLIGGDQLDTMDGGNGEDLMIGGIVTHNSNALDALLATWAGPLSYEQRIQAIEDTNFIGYLQSHDTVMDDYVPDEVVGSNDRDWFFLPGALATYDAAGVGGTPHSGGSHHHSGPILIPNLPVVEGFELIDSLDHLDNKQDESVHTIVPHGDNPTKQKEHLTLFELVRYDQVTHTALSSGDWSNPAIWENGILPSNDSRVLIPHGIEVTVDGVISAQPFSVRIDGTLSFATNVNTQLSADTIIGSAGSSIVVGTAANPIAANVTAKVLFTDGGPIDRTYDPFGISRGLITHGSVEVFGAAKTSFVKAVGNITAGQSVIQLDSIPTNWQIGDTIKIGGTSYSQNEDETRTILAISGNQIGVAPLTYNHLTPDASLNVHIANLTRNVVFQSETTDIARRGHTMFMHNRNAHVSYASFLDLGRTDKSVPLNDSVVDANWQLTPGTGTNQRARYSVHFHRNGTLIDGNPSTFHGSVVDDSPGWGFVNHSSYVEFTDNVAANVNGAGFATEVGDETGLFRDNIAFTTTGTDENDNDRIDLQDFGHTGAGFWFQGAGISVVDNVSVGSHGSGFIFYTRGLIEGTNGLPAHYLTANLADPSIAGGAETILVDHVPVLEFTGNESYGSSTGFTVRYHLRDVTHNGWSTFSDSIFWNNETGIDIPYTQQTILRNLTVKRDVAEVANGIAVLSNPVTADIIYDNLDVSGYYNGIVTPRAGRQPHLWWQLPNEISNRSSASRCS